MEERITKEMTHPEKDRIMRNSIVATIKKARLSRACDCCWLNSTHEMVNDLMDVVYAFKGKEKKNG